MITSEMIVNFLVEYDRVASLSAPSYEDSEILQFLNRSQYDLTEILFQSRNLELLGILSVSAKVSAVLGGFDTLTELGAVRAETSHTQFTRFLHYLDSYSQVTRVAVPAMSATYVKNSEIPKNQARFYQTSDFNSPIFRYPKTYIDGEYVVVIPDAYSSIDEITVDYIMNPKELVTSVSDATSETVTCELPESLHEEVITKAVQLAQITINPPQAEANIKLTQKP